MILALGVIIGAVTIVVASCLRCEVIPTEDRREYVLNTWTGRISIYDPHADNKRRWQSLISPPDMTSRLR